MQKNISMKTTCISLSNWNNHHNKDNRNRPHILKKMHTKIYIKLSDQKWLLSSSSSRTQIKAGMLSIEFESFLCSIIVLIHGFSTFTSSPALGHNKYIKNSLWAFLPGNQSLQHTTNTKHTHMNPGKGIGRSRSPGIHRYRKRLQLHSSSSNTTSLMPEQRC